MLKKILHIAITIFLLPFPFIGAIDILKKFSPYFNNNNVNVYICVSIACGLGSAVAAFLITNKTLDKPFLFAGILLFLNGVLMTSIAGLAAPPDFSPVMLQHPEREHYRYSLLFLNLLFFIAAFILIIRSRWHSMQQWNKWIIVPFIIAIAEMAWEFQHHFSLGNHLQNWINEGKNAADFMTNYTSELSVRLSGIARAMQYTTIAWLATILFKAGRIKIWVLIVLAVFCITGFCTGIAVAVMGYASFEKLKALLLFVIPGGAFVLLYWLGLALLTKKNK